MATREQLSRRRIGLVDRQAIEASLDIAALSLLPEEYSQRDVFRVLMPKLFVMRKRGFGFKQITKLLNEAGLKLAIGSVRTYYHEFLMEMLEQCEAYFRSSEKTLKSGEQHSGALRMPADRESAIAQAQAQARSQLDNEVQAQTNATLGRILGKSQNPAPSSGAAGALLAPAPAGGHSVRSPESPASRGTSTRPTIGTSDASKKPTAPRPTRRPRNPDQPHPLVADGAGSGSATCVTDPEKDQVKEEPGLPDQVYQDVLLEHPAIKGLLLTKMQRFYTLRLQYKLSNGELKLEKGAEMVARRSWKVPESVRKGRTSGDFVEMQSDILGKAKS